MGKTNQKIDPYKTQGYHNLSIHMLKLCGDTICTSLEIYLIKS